VDAEQRMRSYFMTEIEERGPGHGGGRGRRLRPRRRRRGRVHLGGHRRRRPGMAPGTGTPEPGGMTSRQLLDTVPRLSKDLVVLGADVVEVSPPTTCPGDHRLPGQPRRARGAQRDGRAQAGGVRPASGVGEAAPPTPPPPAAGAPSPTAWGTNLGSASGGGGPFPHCVGDKPWLRLRRRGPLPPLRGGQTLAPPPAAGAPSPTAWGTKRSAGDGHRATNAGWPLRNSR
jgi:hypothetical protein